MILYILIVAVIVLSFAGFYFRYNPAVLENIGWSDFSGTLKFLQSDNFLLIALIATALLTLIFCIIEITGDLDDDDADGINILSILGTIFQRVGLFLLGFFIAKHYNGSALECVSLGFTLTSGTLILPFLSSIGGAVFTVLYLCNVEISFVFLDANISIYKIIILCCIVYCAMLLLELSILDALVIAAVSAIVALILKLCNVAPDFMQCMVIAGAFGNALYYLISTIHSFTDENDDFD